MADEVDGNTGITAGLNYELDEDVLFGALGKIVKIYQKAEDGRILLSVVKSWRLFPAGNLDNFLSVLTILLMELL